ncbi:MULTISPECIES: SF1B family DNA helicase RecD2 [Clostridia]|uniref:SF1B family DNA helicase RecD2 n=1 Tax=Clostridia TaxID=186801 RepID=UPI000E53F62B|nr:MULTISPECIES: ATP-dependent RecD-like DNA helicase [Clostridia]RHV72032.1 ATP-dependent RecD-like DNA helicase [Roseburia sp. OM02-15]
MSTQKGTLINKYTPDYVIFDLETTGISPNYDEVIEISALKVKGGEVVDEFNTLVNPGRKIPFGATKVNGITNAMVAEAPAFSHVLAEFLDFAEGLVLVGHNIARFDMKFIWRDAEQYFGEIPQNNYVDTLQVARKHLPKMDHHRLVDLAEHYGISSEGAHRALNDCYMNQKVYECMVSEMREAQKKRVEEARKKASEAANRSIGQKSEESINNQANSHQVQTENVQSQAVEVQQRPQHFTVKIRGVVERITYQNPENGYTVLKCAVKSYKELVTVIGSLLDVNVGSVLLIYGNWKVDSRYGRQFAAESWEETLPATVFGIEKYLGSGLIKGVGPKYAKKIVAQFGTETLEVIETDISRLQEVDGIGKKRIKMIRDSWERQKEIKNVMLFLQDHGVSTSFAAKIYRQYGNESLEKMKENPFQMADDIWGIGFKTADGIAQKLGFAKEAYVRLRSGIMYTLSNLADEGHVFAYQEQLIAKAAELLEAEESSIVMTLDQMIMDKDLICETVDYNTDQAEMKAIYLPAFYYAEAGVAGKLKRLAQAPAADRLWHALMDARQKTGNESLSIDVSKIQEKVHMEYDEIQADAIRKAAVSKVMVLTGGPGTGKTTTTQGIIAAYRSFGLKILLAAPTGRAAKRMTEATGLEAKTIHRLLECKPPEGYQKNEDNPLEGDVLIIDECSMIDMILMNALLKAIPEGMRLILVGDIDQLPSVGAGNVLRDIIDSGVFPVVRLTRIFRQAQSSRIIMNAHAINEGKFPDISNGKNTDFFYIEKEDPEEAVQEIVRLVKNNLPRYYKTPWNHIQVLTPMQKGIVGAANLNLALQEALNPQGDGLRRGGYLFRAGDKVMQIRNNYEKEIFNGDIGTVESVDLQERMLKVNFDQHIIEYEASELDELVHAYATTIHKAQGSEYPIVVMPVLMNHYVMLQRNLIYTGITRAKKVLVIVGTRKALSYAVRNVTVTKRNTFLKERLCET